MVYAAEQLFERIRERMRAVTQGPAQPRQKLLEMIRSIFEFFNENMFYFQFLDRAQVYSKMHQSAKVNHVTQERQMIADILREGVEKKSFRDVDVENAADFFQRAIVGTICVQPQLRMFDPAKEAALLAEMFYAFLES
ncbi:MAG: hypothetical protein LLF76_00975 [Planctomycetaceae bacterium]|nr:hypothetical protein [Planctomycetaceae bacterium]